MVIPMNRSCKGSSKEKGVGDLASSNSPTMLNESKRRIVRNEELRSSLKITTSLYTD